MLFNQRYMELFVSLVPAWSPFFPANARMRGKALQLEEKVTVLDPREGEIARTEVIDGDDVHTVTFRADKKQVVCECSCEIFETGTFCPHIWASLLCVQKDPATLTKLRKLKPRPPKAKKRAGAALREKDPEWMNRLTLLRPPTVDLDGGPALGIQRKLIYVVLTDVSDRQAGLFVEVRFSTPTITGWSKPKALKLSPYVVSTLTDPADRRLCGLIMGATGVLDLDLDTMRAERACSVFRLTPGLRRELLAQLISTDRCYLDTVLADDGDKARPLRWQDKNPWTLWMIGRQVDEDAALLISAELRRQVAVRSMAHMPEALQQLVANNDVEMLDAEDDGAANAFETEDAETGSLETDKFDDALDASTNGSTVDIDTNDASEDGDPANADLDDDATSSEASASGGQVTTQTADVDEPALVFGGRDGIVIFRDHAAPFDDHDAFRWCGQFRDAALMKGDEAAIKVPLSDVERFFDRLYLLPQLPNIDLPEDLGPSEVTVQPEPVLELFSPESPQAAEVLNSGAKNTVVGRVVFHYGQQRISPIQSGRYVPVPPDQEKAIEEVVAAAPGSSTPGSAPGNEAALANTSEPALQDASANEAMDEAQSATNTAVAEQPEAGAQAVAPGDNTEQTGPTKRRLVRRDPSTEHSYMEKALAAGFRPAGSEAGDSLLIHSKDVTQAVAGLSGNGWKIVADQRMVRAAGTPSLSVVSGIDWFELRGGVKFTLEDGTETIISLPEILQAARSGRQMIELADGSHGLLPEAWLEENGLLTTLGEAHEDGLRFKPSQVALLDALLRENDLVEVDPAFDAIRARLAEFEGVKPANEPNGFLGKLREYQAEGTGWFGFLRWFGVGGILADDMGLGKTVQVLAMLQGRKIGAAGYADVSVLDDPNNPNGATSLSLGPAKATTSKGETSKGASLIVAPRSVLFNWLDETKKFTPDIRVMAYAGTEREELRAAFNDYDLVVTTYGLMRRDVEELSQYKFDYVVLDEAQAIKNPASQSAKAARLLNSNHRLALTGTPVENHLGDLWSIFEYLNPGMLGSHLRFAEMIRSTSAIAAAQQDNQVVPQVGKALRPFILRRTKTQVLKDLPAKTEQTLVCEMEPAQQAVYDEMKSYYRGNLMQQLDEQGVAAGGGVGKQSFMVLEALLRLRQAACHPGLIDENRRKERSAKCDVLYERLADIIDEGSKALVFSQFTSMLDIVRSGLQERGIRYCYLDGQTRDRREVVDQFQNEPANSVFLISLKAGGFGLNLTAAEYVFILDPWWNPAVEAQAIDRSHRMGQTKPVFAYRLVCKDTVEQRILDLQQQKRDLADAIVGGEQNPLKSLSRADLENLLT